MTQKCAEHYLHGTMHVTNILQASFRRLFMENAADYRNLTDFIRTVQLQTTTVIYVWIYDHHLLP